MTEADKDAIQTHDKGATASNSESENPVIASPTPKPTRPRTNRDWWPNQPDLSVLHQHPPSPIRWVRSTTTRKSLRLSTSTS